MGKQQSNKQTIPRNDPTVIPRNDPTVMVTARIRKSVNRALEIEAAQTDTTKAQLVEKALMSMLGLKEAKDSNQSTAA